MALVTTNFEHRPVLLSESVAHLNLAPGATVIDGTLGGGGHGAAILEATSPDGILIGLDLDPDALEAAGLRLARYGERVHRVRSSFRHLDRVIHDLGIREVDGVLLDLGVSSHQLDTPQRGFRFAEAESNPADLDMRMGPDVPETAAELLRNASAAQLQEWFQNYGELPGSKRLAAAIVETRKHESLESTADLLRVIRSAGIGRGRKHNPATLVFQALRIAVNDELAALSDGLDAAIQVLRPGGRLVVIAYHSLEDRIVKHRMREEARGCVCPPRVPVCVCDHSPTLRLITRRPIRPSDEEVRTNPRARSGLLRVAERLGDAA